MIPAEHLARTTDPTTSHQSARAVSLTADSQRTALLIQYHVDMRHERGLTDAEAAARLHYRMPYRWGYWKRCADLRKLGYIEPCGITHDPETGRAVTLCRITADGIAAAARVRRGS